MTPAQRVRARRDPAIARPPRPIRGSRTSAISGLRLQIAGREYPIGANVEGDTPWELTIEGAGTVTVPIRSPDDSLADVLGDETLLQEQGVRVTVDGVVYVVADVDADGTGLYTLTLGDEVKWRLEQFSSFMSADRRTTTRFGFIQRFVDEASRPPLARIRAFIPEVDDVQPIRQPTIESS